MILRLTLLALILNSCGQGSLELAREAKNTIPATSTNQALINRAPLTLKDWSNLVLNKKATESSNFALATLFASTVAAEDRENVMKFIKEYLPEDQSAEIIEQVLKNRAEFIENKLFEKNPYLNTDSFKSITILNSNEIKTSNVFGFDNQLKLKVAVSVQSNYLKEIKNTFEKNSSDAAKTLAAVFSSELNQTQKSKIDNIINNPNYSQENAVKMIEGIFTGISKGVEFRNKYKFSNIQLLEVGVGAAALALYVKKKHGETLDKVIGTVQMVKSALDTINESTKIIKQVDKTFSEIGSSTKKMYEATADIGNMLARDLKNPKTTIDMRQHAIEIKRCLIDSKCPDSLDDKSIKSMEDGYKDKIKEIQKYSGQLGSQLTGMSNNINNIVSTIRNLSNVVGIKIGSDGEKLLNAAATVAKVAQVAGSIMQGFASGGPFGAATAALSSLFGGGQSATDAKLDKLDRKMDQMLSLQKQSIQLQIDTMKMIENVAKMIDEYHHQVMEGILDIKSLQLTALEFEKFEMNKGIRSCERLINYQLSKNDRMILKNNASFIDVNRESFFGGKTNSYDSLGLMMSSTEVGGFKDCQTGISEAFGMKGSMNIEENPIRSIFQTKDGQDFRKVDFNYSMLVKLLKEEIINNATQFNSVLRPLHFPVQNFSYIAEKNNYLTAESPFGIVEQEIYQIDSLLHADSLIRYASALLVLYPLIDLQVDKWELGPKYVIDKLIRDLQVSGGKSRSKFLLENALYMTRSTIAQYAILAGEPLLEKLNNTREYFKSESDLRTAIYSMPRLATNLFHYAIFKSGSDDINLASLKTILEGFGGEVKTTKKNNKEIFIYEVKNAGKSIVFELPNTFDDVQSEIVYPTAVVDLIKLERKIIEAILQVSPDSADELVKKQFAAMILKQSL